MVKRQRENNRPDKNNKHREIEGEGENWLKMCVSVSWRECE